MMKMVIRTGWLSGIEERCLLGRLLWVSCVTLLLLTYGSSCVVEERAECRNFYYKEKTMGLKPRRLKKPVKRTLCAAERALPWR